MKHKIIFAALMLAVGILNGCGAARPSKFYQLTAVSDRAAGADPSPYEITLLLGPITSSHLYRDDHIVYTSNGQAMGTYEYQRWAEPPSEMIDDVLLRGLPFEGFECPVATSMSIRCAAMSAGTICCGGTCMTSGRSPEMDWQRVLHLSSSCAISRRATPSGPATIRTMNRWTEKTCPQWSLH